ncbi:hypothetical protein AGMMS49938_18190 [Fibrobacterales bacterium]|nr:hypothetical protein AGMMS49938_18190 [Fibrobacterales bacterium]
MSKEKVIVWGIGENYKWFAKEIYSKFEVVALVDSDKGKQGKIIDGLQVSSPSSVLNSVKWDLILLTPKMYFDIEEELLKSGIDGNKIISYYIFHKIDGYKQIFGTRNKSVSPLTTSILNSSDFELFADWKNWNCDKKNRKSWEFVYIYKALEERGLLKNDKKGLVFAVGKEILPSVFASKGCIITASDCPPELVDEGWSKTNQHSDDLENLYYPNLADKETFTKNVSFQQIDMRSIPHTLKNFDFVWTTCALEHLGSLTASKFFIERAMDCLKPGGFAVHTTEFNLSGGGNTVRNGGSVFFRPTDVIELFDSLIAQGHKPSPIDFTIEDFTNRTFIADCETWSQNKGAQYINIFNI